MVPRSFIILTVLLSLVVAANLVLAGIGYSNGEVPRILMLNVGLFGGLLVAAIVLGRLAQHGDILCRCGATSRDAALSFCGSCGN